jgi:hypothetical protein
MLSYISRKNGLRLALASAAMIGLGVSAGASAATANATAEVIKAISITKSADLNFAGIVPAASAGSVKVAADGTRTCTTVSCAGTAAAASFSVSGESGYTYAVTLPGANVSLAHATDTTASMTIVSTSFAEASGSGTHTLDANGADTVTVGATLDVGANQVAGDYSGSFNVTVEYN